LHPALVHLHHRMRKEGRGVERGRGGISSSGKTGSLQPVKGGESPSTNAFSQNKGGRLPAGEFRRSCKLQEKEGGEKKKLTQSALILDPLKGRGREGKGEPPAFLGEVLGSKAIKKSERIIKRCNALNEWGK